jgi:DNA-binding transcriptional LysR family regulator
VGITRLLSYQVADRIADRTLTRLLVDYEPEAVPVSLLYARQGRLPAKTRVFVEQAADRLTSAVGLQPR